MLPVVVLVVGIAAAAVALVLPHTASHRIDAALGQLRDWPSVTIDGRLTSGTDPEPVDVHAVITGDGMAAGVLERSDGARAEFAVDPGATLLRGNLQWWLDEPPVLAGRLTDRWISNASEEAVGHVAAGRLTPAALADALSVLRDPDERTTTDAVVAGVFGVAFARDGVRLVINDDGRPLGADIPLVGVHPASTFRAGAPDPEPTSTLALGLTRPGPADDAAARRAVADVLTELGAHSAAELPSQDDITRQVPATPPVAIQVVPQPGCRPTGCRLRVRVANLRPVPTTGLFVLRVEGEVVRSETLTLPPLVRAELSIALPAGILPAGGSFTTKATFDLLPGVVDRPAPDDQPVGDDPYESLTASSGRGAADREALVL